jgi:hypothetical protein
MRKLYSGLLLITAIITNNIFASGSDGNALLMDCKEAIKYLDADGDLPSGNSNLLAGLCIGIIQGTNETYGYWELFSHGGLPNPNQSPTSSLRKEIQSRVSICIPSDVKMIQVVKLIVKFLENNPENLNDSPSSIVIMAEKKYFSCNKGNS